MPKFAVPGRCWQGYFLDPDHNVFGISKWMNMPGALDFICLYLIAQPLTHNIKYRFIKVVGYSLLFSWTGRNQGKHIGSSGKKEMDTSGIVKTKTTSSALDTVWFPFSDSSYRLNIHIFKPGGISDNDINAVITFSQVKAGKTRQIFRDSLFVHYYIDRQDFNNDHVKDILVYNHSGGAR